MSKKYLIEGGYPLKGIIKPNGNKNAALPAIAAALLTDEEVILRNIPNIEDVNIMLEISTQLGATVKKIDKNTLSIKGGISSTTINPDLGKKIRTSILFAGPLLARAGEAILPPPGGDVIGRRRLDTHFIALSELGCRIEISTYFKMTANKLVGKEIFLDEMSVTATENAVMAAVLAEGNTTILNAASEPHVQDLCNMLISMGAKIDGVGSNIIRITGVEKLHGTDFTIGTDFMEVGSLIGLAAVTRGEIEITNANPENMRMSRLVFGKLGIRWETDGSSIFVPAHQELKVISDIGGMIPKIDDSPWPGFPPDLISIIIVTATQVEGTVLIFEKMFESRMFFVDKLVSMGARIILCDPHRAVVSGPARLKGLELSSPDIRAGMALVLAALCAEGRSVINNIIQIERGYESLPERLHNLGAKISVVDN
ncbi:MAG TPA: UDP-N-acetylglucosamine 1-carboxyvinyltransferase [Spirochaetota bacterium]|nr:UDP-N-acetylglucosamine 1-carboxyvinyltransferase [Spirochaetota bacterium]HOS32098.1 UDP-N-acetylglucosamine 1-carboxyvinyltransferase [Spirochaetota bacterium]HOS55439.1 UDP-N-acetylglucosamine 1-carboxyvinyltransferase [Spirochaetota bacterium]HPK60853.1 UDP-N-acetylglucosamine 1-carboxyvinyltransferase [Spirochaetota bacterium]HQF78001.1 UDP-N-acetylglucosamine 1-carboxyvinyltransferase [Spirochaetota bacterium]